MGKTTGVKITATEFGALRKGDVYFITDKRECRTFERFAKCYTKRGEAKAVNSVGHVNPLADMRWPTLVERNAYLGVREPQAEAPRPCATNVSARKETKQMGKCNAVSDALCVVKGDTQKAAWRTAAKQAVKAVRAPLSALLSKSLPTGLVGVVLSQLDTSTGEALLAVLVGHGMTYVPQFSCDARLMRLAEELRVGGTSHFTDLLAEAVLAPIREQLVDVVKMIPFGNDAE